MLEGLEITVIKFSEISYNKDKRIDSEFHTVSICYNPKLIYTQINNILTKSQYGISVSMNESGNGLPIYRMNEIHNVLCDSQIYKFAELTKEEIQIFKLADRDVLFNRTNSYEWVGRTGLFRKSSDLDIVFASYLVRFNTDYNQILPEYLTAFLNCRYGILDIKRRSRPSINQTNVNPEEVKEIKIPLIEFKIQEKIKHCFDSAHKSILDSESLYFDSEKILLKQLGLTNWQPSEENISIKKLSESYAKTERLDAEYYQPKNEEIKSKIKSIPNSLFQNCVSIYEQLNIPEPDTKYNYIELADIGDFGFINETISDFGKNLPGRARRLVKTGDVIISSIEGSLNKCALINENYNGSFCSTGFHVINSSEILPEVLLLLFKSFPYQMMMKLRCTGTILTALNKEELKMLLIPIIPPHLQKELSEQVQKSFYLRQKGINLLEAAKQTVEIAIEQDEKAAFEFLNNF